MNLDSIYQACLLQWLIQLQNETKHILFLWMNPIVKEAFNTHGFATPRLAMSGQKCLSSITQGFVLKSK